MNPIVPSSVQWNPSLELLPFSPIRQMFNEANMMLDDVLHLSIGQPDFPTPSHIIEANIEALREGKTRYEMDAGLPQLRSAIARFYAERYNITLDAENVLLTTGCCQAMYIALTGAVVPGKEVIVAEPYFVLTNLVEHAGGILHRVLTRAKDGYQLDPQRVIDAMSEKTCAVLLNSPGNPTGAVYPPETIRAITEEAAKRGITVISDEVYDRLILDDVEYASALEHSPSLDHIIMASSVSKTYAMAGMRVGWLISSKENIATLQRYHMYISTTENTASQWATLAAFEGPQDCVEEMVSAYRARRDRVVQLIADAPCLTGYEPSGAFFVMPSLPDGADGWDIAIRMLREISVCTIPGRAFGPSCSDALRISFATDMQTIESAFERMVPWLNKQFS